MFYYISIKHCSNCEKFKAADNSDYELQISGNVLSDSEYRKFQIMEVKQETKNCFRYRIQLPEFSSLGLAIGQHIIIR